MQEFTFPLLFIVFHTTIKCWQRLVGEQKQIGWMLGTLAGGGLYIFPCVLSGSTLQNSCCCFHFCLQNSGIALHCKPPSELQGKSRWRRSSSSLLQQLLLNSSFCLLVFFFFFFGACVFFLFLTQFGNFPSVGLLSYFISFYLWLLCPLMQDSPSPTGAERSQWSTLKTKHLLVYRRKGRK